MNFWAAIEKAKSKWAETKTDGDSALALECEPETVTVVKPFLLSTPPKPAAKNRPKIHPAALAWLQTHKSELKEIGFAAPYLWRRNRPLGLAWFSIWQKQGLSVSIEGGDITFRYKQTDGQTITQTARPMATTKLRGKKNVM